MFGSESNIWGKIASVAGEAVANQAITIMNVVFTVFAIIGVIGGIVALGSHWIKNLHAEADEKESMSKKTKTIVFSMFGLMGLSLIGTIIINVGDSAFKPAETTGQAKQALEYMIYDLTHIWG